MVEYEGESVFAQVCKSAEGAVFVFAMQGISKATARGWGRPLLIFSSLFAKDGEGIL